MPKRSKPTAWVKWGNSLSLLLIVLALVTDWFEYQVSWNPARNNYWGGTTDLISLESTGVVTAFPFAQSRYSSGTCYIPDFSHGIVLPRRHQIIPTPQLTTIGFLASGVAGITILVNLIILVMRGWKEAILMLVAGMIAAIAFAYLPSSQGSEVLENFLPYDIWISKETETSILECPIYVTKCREEGVGCHAQPSESTYITMSSNRAEWKFLRVLPLGPICLTLAFLLADASFITLFRERYRPRRPRVPPSILPVKPLDQP